MAFGLRGSHLSLPMLIEAEDRERSRLNDLIVDSANVDHDNEHDLRKCASDIKEVCQSFTTANKSLTNYHLRHGNTDEANEVRKIRYQMISSDVAEAIQFINMWLHKLNLPPVSEVASVSNFSYTSKNKTLPGKASVLQDKNVLLDTSAANSSNTSAIMNLNREVE